MLDNLVLRVLGRTLPDALPGRSLHRHALACAVAGRPREAERWFEAAVHRYRRDLDVEGLARLRVHQLMARARATGDAVVEAEMMLEIVRSLNKLDQLESMAPPFALMDARGVLSVWLAEAPEGARAVAREQLA